MNEDRIIAFLQNADEDPLLKDQISEILAGPVEHIPEELARLSATSKTPFTADEFRAILQLKDLSENELADVAGGYGARMYHDYDRNDKRDIWERIVARFK
jgi:hypothetical protein